MNTQILPSHLHVFKKKNENNNAQRQRREGQKDQKWFVVAQSELLLLDKQNRNRTIISIQSKTGSPKMSN